MACADWVQFGATLFLRPIALLVAIFGAIYWRQIQKVASGAETVYRVQELTTIMPSN